MKRTILLNRHLSFLISKLGHLDEIVIADAGLPAPSDVQVIDLAVMPGVPSFHDVLVAISAELVVETVVHAGEASSELLNDFTRDIELWSDAQGKPISIQCCTHEELKIRARSAKAVIRTGEITPYCNLILVSGVAF